MGQRRLDGARLEIVLRDMPVERVRVTAMTQTPAVLCAADGVTTRTLLPGTMGCRVPGRLDERARKASLRVTAIRPIPILACCPEAWGDVEITVADRTLPPAFEQVEQARFARLDLAAGEHEVTLRAIPQ